MWGRHSACGGLVGRLKRFLWRLGGAYEAAAAPPTPGSVYNMVANSECAAWPRKTLGGAMEKPAQNIQDSFLNNARKDKIVLTIYLMSGVKLSGRIKSFDKYSLVLETNNQEQLIFKHAISTVVTSEDRPTPTPAGAPGARRAAPARHPLPAHAGNLGGLDLHAPQTPPRARHPGGGGLEEPPRRSLLGTAGRRRVAGRAGGAGRQRRRGRRRPRDAIARRAGSRHPDRPRQGGGIGRNWSRPGTPTW